MNIRPLSDRVVVKPLEVQEVTKTGIVLPDSAKEKPLQGVVVAVGPGRILENGTRSPMDCKVGDRVIFPKFSGIEFKLDGVEYLILGGDREILGIVEGEIDSVEHRL